MFGLLIGLGLSLLIPLFVIAVAVDVICLMFALGWKALAIGAKLFFGILSFFGICFTMPLLIAILILL